MDLICGDYMDWVRAALVEDCAFDDVTSKGCVPADYVVTLDMVSRSTICLAGGGLAVLAFRQMDPDVQIDGLVPDGAMIPAGGQIMQITGQARALLGAERVALNILHVMSAMATHTARLAGEIAHTPARLRDTRKTVPGWRALSKYAVRMGGGVNHRFSLADAVLVKDNHIALHGGDIGAVVRALRAYTDLPIQMECDRFDQVQQALAQGVDQILLDNMTPDVLRQAVLYVDGRVPLEASGGIGLHNIRAVAETGVDFIAVGSITQFPPPVDIGLDWHLSRT